MAARPSALPTRLALPQVVALVAPPGWQRIDFISDLHLSARTPRTFEAWAAHLQNTDADAMFILGDLVETWVGDDGRFDGFDARFAETFAALARLRPTYFMAGNRDFMVGNELLSACGVQALADPTRLSAFGQHGLLMHGDELCLDDVDYQRLRRQVRDPAWQRQMLSQPLAVRREFARDLRARSEAHQRASGRTSELWADIDPPTAAHWLDAAGADFIVHGHTHRPGSQALAPGRFRHVLSDWDLEDPSASRAEVLSWTAAGPHRHPPSAS